MQTPAAAIAWEIWRKNRWAFISIFGLALLCGSLNFSSAFLLNSELFNAIRPDLLTASALLMGFSILAGFGIFSYSEPDRESGFAFPSRFFVLPIGSWKLAALLALYGIVGIAAIYLAWAWLAFMPLDVEMPAGYHLACLAAALVLFQTILWGLAFAPKIRALAAISLVFGLLAVSMAPFGQVGWDTARSLRGIGRFAALAALIHLGTWFLIRKERAGGWNEFWASLMSRSIAPEWHMPMGSLASPGRALGWIEWHRNGRIPALVMVATLVPLVIAYLVPLGQEVVTGIALLFFLVVPPLLLIFIGAFAARDCVSNQLNYSAYMGTAPCSIETMLLAKLRTLGILSGIAFAVGCVHCSLLLGSDAIPNPFKDLHETAMIAEPFGGFRGMRFGSLEIIAASVPALALCAIVGGLPLWLTGIIRSVPVTAGLSLAMALAIGQAFVWIFDHTPNVLPLMFLWAIVLKGIIAIIGFRIAYLRRLLKMRTIVRLVLVWASITIFFTVGSIFCFDLAYAPRILMLAVPLLCPLARIALAPLALEYNRHH